MPSVITCCISNAASSNEPPSKTLPAFLVITALVSIILIGLGAAGILPHAGNIAVIVVGGIGLALCLAGTIYFIINCLKKEKLEPKKEPEKKASEERKKIEAEWRAKMDAPDDGKGIISTQQPGGQYTDSTPEGRRYSEVLWYCIEIKDLELFKRTYDLAVKDGYDFQEFNFLYGYTQFQTLSKWGTVEMLEFLEERGIVFEDPPTQYNGCSAIHFAISSNNADTLRYILSKKEHEKNKLYDQGSPLHCTVGSLAAECLEILLDAGADLDIKDPTGKMTAFDHLMNVDKKSYARLLKDGMKKETYLKMMNLFVAAAPDKYQSRANAKKKELGLD